MGRGKRAKRGHSTRVKTVHTKKTPKKALPDAPTLTKLKGSDTAVLPSLDSVRKTIQEAEARLSSVNNEEAHLQLPPLDIPHEEKTSLEGAPELPPLLDKLPENIPTLKKKTPAKPVEPLNIPEIGKESLPELKLPTPKLEMPTKIEPIVLPKPQPERSLPRIALPLEKATPIEEVNVAVHKQEALPNISIEDALHARDDLKETKEHLETPELPAPKKGLFKHHQKVEPMVGVLVEDIAKPIPEAHLQPVDHKIPEPQILQNVTTEKHHAKVEPELALWLRDGRVVRSVKELQDALATMDPSVYKQHRQAGDISEWVRDVIGNEELAKSFEKPKREALKHLKGHEAESHAQLQAQLKEKEIHDAIKQAQEIKHFAYPKQARSPLQASLLKEAESVLEEDLSPLEEAQTIEKTKLPEHKKSPLNESILKSAELALEPPQLEPTETPKDTETPDTPQPVMPKHNEVEEDTQPYTVQETQPAYDKLEAPILETKSREEELEDQLTQREQQLDTEEEELNRKRLEIANERYRLIKERGRLEKKRFDEFMRAHNKIKAAQDEPLPEYDYPASYEKEQVLQLIEQTKQAIHEDNLTEAKSKVEELKRAMAVARIPVEDSRRLEYEVLELETDIKLAAL